MLGAAASCAAVGVSIAVDKIVNAMAENEETVYVAPFCYFCTIGVTTVVISGHPWSL